MTYGLADFFSVFLIGWAIVFLLHQTIGGLIGLFTKGIQKRHAIEIVNAKNKK
jgi:hypothetical protein